MNKPAGQIHGQHGAVPPQHSAVSPHPPSQTAEQFMTSSAIVADGDDGELWEQDLNFAMFTSIFSGKMFHTSSNEKSPPSALSRKLLLDNQATCDVISNAKYLTNIRLSDHKLIIKTNTGSGETKWIGELPGYGTVWFYEQGAANILSLARVTKRYPVTYNSAIDNCFTVHKSDGTKLIFRECEKGLHVLDLDSSIGELFTTVAEQEAKYHPRDVAAAKLARNIQNIIGHPSSKNLARYVDSNLLPNCPISGSDVRAGDLIYGKSLGSLKGKTTRSSSTSVPTTEAIPPSIPSRYKNVTIAGDVMTVNGIHFMVTISTKLRFGTSERIHALDAKTLLTAINRVFKLYATRSFQVTEFRADGQFECLRHDLPTGISGNICGEGEHVPAIERHIRTIKERCRCVMNTLPFKKIPPRMTAEMVGAMVFWLNCFPPSRGVSRVLSPRQLVIGEHIDYNKHCLLEFGTYVQTHDEHDNSMKARTTGAIALRPTGNSQGGYFFYSLQSGLRLHRRPGAWTVVPTPHGVIDRVHELAKDAPEGITFDDFPDDPADDQSDDDSYAPSDSEDISLDDNFFAAPTAGVDDDTDDGDKSEANEEESVIDEADDETTGVADDVPEIMTTYIPCSAP